MAKAKVKIDPLHVVEQRLVNQLTQAQVRIIALEEAICPRVAARLEKLEKGTDQINRNGLELGAYVGKLATKFKQDDADKAAAIRELGAFSKRFAELSERVGKLTDQSRMVDGMARHLSELQTRMDTQSQRFFALERAPKLVATDPLDARIEKIAEKLFKRSYPNYEWRSASDTLRVTFRDHARVAISVVNTTP